MSEPIYQYCYLPIIPIILILPIIGLALQHNLRFFCTMCTAHIILVRANKVCCTWAMQAEPNNVIAIGFETGHNKVGGTSHIA